MGKILEKFLNNSKDEEKERIYRKKSLKVEGKGDKKDFFFHFFLLPSNHTDSACTSLTYFFQLNSANTEVKEKSRRD